METQAAQFAGMIPALQERKLADYFSALPRFGSVGRLYSFTTENLSGYMPLLSIQNGRVLTVSGSGDQVLNAALLGAREVIHFDINQLALWWAELKFAAASMLTHSGFLRFFLRDRRGVINQAALNYAVYQLLSPLLSSEARHFFNQLYAACSFDGMLLRRSDLFKQQYDFSDLKIRSNPYLKSKENFNKMQQLLKHLKITGLVASLKELPDLVSGCFSSILLSNIADYAAEIYPAEPSALNSFATEMVFPHVAKLTAGSHLVAAYIYASDQKGPCRSEVDCPDRRRAAFQMKGCKFQEISFAGVIPDKKDAVAVITKEEEL